MMTVDIQAFNVRQHNVMPDVFAVPYTACDLFNVRLVSGKSRNFSNRLTATSKLDI